MRAGPAICGSLGMSDFSLVPRVRITKLHCYCKHSVLCIGWARAQNGPTYTLVITCIDSLASFPGLSEEGERPGDYCVCMRESYRLFSVQYAVKNHDVIVHGESVRKEYADTFVYTVIATI